jgi:hypothetical protein
MGMTKNRKPTFGDEIRAAVRNCGKTRYAISQETGIDAAALCRFVSGERGLSLDSLDLLADFLGLHVTTRQDQPTERQDQRGKSRKRP